MRPRYIDPEAEGLLETSGYYWDDFIRGYRRARLEHESVPGYFEAKPIAIAVEELAAHGLLSEDVSEGALRSGLRWLEDRIKLADQ
jgi:hypothetical protein